MNSTINLILRSLLLFLLISTAGSLHAQSDWKAAMKDATLKYAENRTQEFVAEANKKAILTIYKKLYPNLRNKGDREALRQLSSLGLDASRLNSLAADLASGDPAKVQNAGETLAVDLGNKLAKNLKDPYLRAKMTSLLGSADKINEISTVLGSAAGGDGRAAAEYVGDLFISAAGGASVVGFYRTAHGVMKFAKDAYVDAEIEELYQDFKRGKLDPMRLDLAGTHFALRDKIIAERENRLSELGNVDITDELREHLTHVSEQGFKENLLKGFESRQGKELSSGNRDAAVHEMEAQAQLIIGELDTVASREFGAGWWKEKQWNLPRFLEIIRERTSADPDFDPEDPTDLAIMSRLLAKKLVYGGDSPEYREALEHFNELKTMRGNNLEPTGEKAPAEEKMTDRFSGSLTGTWSGTFTTYKIGVKGGFEIRVGTDGEVSGTFNGGDSGSLSGRVDSSGAIDVKTGGGQAGTYRWTGSINRAPNGSLSGRGSWGAKGASGTWQGTGG